MNRQLITWAGAFVAIFSFTLASADVEARCCRSHHRNRCCQQTSNYGYQGGNNCGYQTGGQQTSSCGYQGGCQQTNNCGGQSGYQLAGTCGAIATTCCTPQSTCCNVQPASATVQPAYEAPTTNGNGSPPNPGV